MTSNRDEKPPCNIGGTPHSETVGRGNQNRLGDVEPSFRSGFPVCPVCGGGLVEIKLKWICSRCHTICETCCEGGPG